MRKKLTAFLLTVVWLLTAPLAAFADETGPVMPVPQAVRVGLEAQQREKDQIAIGNASVVFGMEISGQFWACGTLAGPLVAVPSGLHYVRLDAMYADFAQAQAAASGITAYAAFPGFAGPGEWYVYVGSFRTDAEINAARAALGGVAVQGNASRVLVTSGGANVLLNDSPYKLQIAGVDGAAVVLGARSYRGRVELGRYTGAKLSAVNVLPTEEYLYSVVAAEMPQSWHAEALKAQAVASRTYALSRLGRHTDYDLCDGTHCQVYTGKGGEAASAIAAVDATRGLLIYHNGTPITNAVFFSSSGGRTDNSENVWTDALPYLRSVAELNETTARQWTVTLTMAEIGSILRDAGVNIGTIMGVSADRIENDRVQSMTITGTAGTKTYTKESIRTIFALDGRHFMIVNGSVTEAPAQVYVLQNGAAASLSFPALYAVGAGGQVTQVSALGRVASAIGAGGLNSLPIITQSAASVTGANAITIVGSGWGHGVGMSQHGAKGMAELGYGFLDILRWYYTGVEVR